MFSWDKLLALREIQLLPSICSRPDSQYFRKVKQNRSNLITPATPPKSESEKKLARKITFFPLAIEQTTKELKPHTLCVYLYELATEFSSFYNQEKVMVEDQDTQNLRLFLCAKTQLVLEIGLGILGIQTLEEM